MRQWFEYLIAFVPGKSSFFKEFEKNVKMKCYHIFHVSYIFLTAEFNIHSPIKVGPFIAMDIKNNILLQFRLHGPPIRSSPVFTTKLRYIANELDRIQGGSDTIVLLSVWAHFNTYPIEMYIRRIRHIRKAVVHLLDREPDTLVVIRTPNLQKVNKKNCLFGSDWFSLQIDAVLRAMFHGLNVQLLDAWEMTVAHRFPHDIHPAPTIIKNMINLVLSHICPVNEHTKKD